MEGVEETINEESERFLEMDDDLEDVFKSYGLGHDQVKTTTTKWTAIAKGKNLMITFLI